MIDKKDVAIIISLALFLTTCFAWTISILKPSQQENENALPIPYDNTYSWTEIFHGYEAYLDRRIHYSPAIGTSMEPTFGEGDAVIWVEIESIEELKVGDIIIYQHPTRPDEGQIAHRIINIIKNGEYRFETKGDNRSESDAHTPLSSYYVTEEYLRGIVIGVVYDTGTG